MRKTDRHDRVHSPPSGIDFQVTCRVDYLYRFSEEPVVPVRPSTKMLHVKEGPMYVAAPWRVTTTARRQSVVREDTPSVRGLIATVHHLVTVEEV